MNKLHLNLACIESNQNKTQTSDNLLNSLVLLLVIVISHPLSVSISLARCRVLFLHLHAIRILEIDSTIQNENVPQTGGFIV